MILILLLILMMNYKVAHILSSVLALDEVLEDKYRCLAFIYDEAVNINVSCIKKMVYI